MKKQGKNAMPAEILLYICDYFDGEPLFAIAKNVEDIPEKNHGENIGVYILDRTAKFNVVRELK